MDEHAASIRKLLDWMGQSYVFQAVVMTVVMAVLRVLYDDKETKWERIFLEAGMCGLITCCAAALLSYFSLPNTLIVTIGGTVGFLGVNEIRAVIKRLLNKKTGDSDATE